MIVAVGLLLPVGGAIGSGISAGYEGVDPVARKMQKNVATSPFQQQLWAAAELSMADDFAGSDRLLLPMISAPGFKDLTAHQRHAVLALAATNAMLQDELTRSRRLYQRAIQADAGYPSDHYYLSLIQAQQDDHIDAAARLAEAARLSRSKPDDVAIDDRFVYQLLNELDDDAPERLALLQALFDANWDRDGLGADDLWYELALMRVKQGDTGRAAEAVERVRWPDVLVRLRSDRRFDALVDLRAPRFDVEAAARANVGRLRALADERPSNLKVRMDLTYAMLAMGMNAEVIALTDQILSTLDSATAGQAPYEDASEYWPWILNNRAIALRRSDRVDEALQLLVRASAMDELGENNVSQVLNLGTFYCSLGRPEQARAAIAPVGSMSGYGRMVQAAIEHCAAWQAGDRAAAGKALAYLREHRQDAQTIWLDALLREGRLDEAARVLLGQLESVDERAEVLSALQEYRETEPLAGARETHAHWKALKARTDVRQAVERVGRMQQYGIYESSGM